MADYRSNKYWIDPEGKLVEVSDRHILEIIKQPTRFGMTKKWIDAQHKKHGERLGQEGEAREQILYKLMQQGWIRIRYIPRDDFWALQLDPDSGPWKDRVKAWANKMLKSGGEFYSAIKILDTGANMLPPYDTSLGEIAAGALSERRKKGTFAQYLNPAKKTKGRTIAVPCNYRSKAVWRPNPRSCGSFTPTGSVHMINPAVLRTRLNPGAIWGKTGPWSVRIFVGLSVNYTPTYTVDAVVKLVTKIRHRQLLPRVRETKIAEGKRKSLLYRPMAKADASFLYQKGIYEHRDGSRVVSEDSVQIIVLNVDENEPVNVFRVNMLKLAEELRIALHQEQVILQFQKAGAEKETVGLEAYNPKIKSHKIPLDKLLKPVR